MQKPFPAYGIAVLVIGLALGYLFGSRATSPSVPQAPQGHAGHVMPAGQAMDMAHMMAEMNAALQDKSGDIFDKAFIDEMIVHHQGAVDMAEMVLERSERPELRTLAMEIVEAQTREISMMRAWRQEWFGRN